MIFNDYNVLNMKFEDIPYSDKLIKDTEQVQSYMQQDAIQGQVRRHSNQIKLILKNRYKNLKAHLVKEDLEADGKINVEIFCKIIDRLEINKKLVSDSDINEIFENYKLDQTNMDYRRLLNDLHDYKFDPERLYSKDQAYPSAEDNALSNTDDHINSVRFSELVKELGLQRLRSNFYYLDNKKQPINCLENSYNTLVKTRRTLMNYFPTKGEFFDFIKNNIKETGLAAKGTGSARPKVFVDESSKEKVYIKDAQFKQIIDEAFYNINLKLGKHELENLFSVIDYNKQGYVNANDIADIFYDESDRQFVMRVQKMPKGPPPSIRREDLEAIVLDADEQMMKGLMIDPAGQKVKELPMILKAIDDNLFVNEQNFFEKYNAFDKDKDGYVSMNDVKKKMDELNFLNRAEIDK